MQNIKIAQLKVADGNPGKRAIQPEPQPVKGCPAKPEHLSAIGLREWEHATQFLDEMGILTTADGPLLALYAETMELYYEARDLVNEWGIALLEPTGTGRPEIRRNPFIMEMHRARADCIKLLAALGLTPTARAQMGASWLKKHGDEMSEFIA